MRDVNEEEKKITCFREYQNNFMEEGVFDELEI